MNYNEELLKLGMVVDVRKTFPRHESLKWKRRDPAQIQGIVFHQSLEEAGSALGTAKYHVGPNHISDKGLPSLAYCGFIEKSGKLYLANDVEDVTWSQGTAELPGDENHMYLAFCVGGNFGGPGYKGTQEPTQEQLRTVKSLWLYAKSLWKLKNNQIFGHYNFGKPACPGYTIMKIIDGTYATRDWVGSEFNFGTIDGRQLALMKLGFFTSQNSELGHWDNVSKGALIAFQRKAGLVADGVWGKKTEAAIEKALLSA